MTIASQETFTAEDLGKLQNKERSYEIVDGLLVEDPPMGTREASLEHIVARLLSDFLEAENIEGIVLPGTARLRLQRDPDIVYGPDICFVPKDRLPEGPLPKGHLEAVPDFAVEIISESNTYSQIQRKVNDYLKFGARMIWVIDTETRTAHLYSPDGKVERIQGDGDLHGDEAVPGFRINLAEAFKKAGIDG